MTATTATIGLDRESLAFTLESIDEFAQRELSDALLIELVGVDLDTLPAAALAALEAGDGYTFVAGVQPKGRLKRLRVGGADVTLEFKRDGRVTGFVLLEQDGRLDVTMAAAP